MSKLFSIFKHKQLSLPEFSEKVGAVRPYLSSMGSHEKLQILIDVSKVWTYDYDERKAFMQELFDLLSKDVQASLIELLKECIPGRDITEDVPLALSQIKKEKLDEFAAAFA